MRRATRCEVLGLFARACAACPPGGAERRGRRQFTVGCWVLGRVKSILSTSIAFNLFNISHIAICEYEAHSTRACAREVKWFVVVVVVAVLESPNGLSIARAPRHRMSLLTRGFLGLGLIWLLKSRYMLYVVLYVVYSSRARFSCRWLLRRRLDLARHRATDEKARFRALVVRCVEKEDDLLPVPPARSCAQEIVFLRAGE